jgi:hypothetical protein
MNNKEKTLWITRTAILIALLVVAQAATAPLGSTLVTGSIVNLILIIAVMVSGLASGLAVAVLSPILARFFGIGPLWILVPFVAAGNITLVLIWHFIGKIRKWRQYVSFVVALVVAAAAKFAVLYVGIVQLAIPFLLNLTAKQASVISAAFSFPQLITASIGGVLAILILPTLKKAVARWQR